jgi:hypothetical protein
MKRVIEIFMLYNLMFRYENLSAAHLLQQNPSLWLYNARVVCERPWLSHWLVQADE